MCMIRSVQVSCQCACGDTQHYWANVAPILGSTEHTEAVWAYGHGTEHLCMQIYRALCVSGYGGPTLLSRKTATLLYCFVQSTR